MFYEYFYAFIAEHIKLNIKGVSPVETTNKH